MASLRVLMPSNGNTDAYLSANNRQNKSLVIRRPGVPVTSIQTDWMCKRISHFTVSREVTLIGFGLYNNVQPNCYWGHGVATDQINVEISISEFKTGKTIYKSVATLPSTRFSTIQRVHFKVPVVLKPGRLYEAMAYYDHFVPLYLKSDPFLNVQKVGTQSAGELTIGFRQMLPKGRYQADCYPSEIPELIFE